MRRALAYIKRKFRYEAFTLHSLLLSLLISFVLFRKKKKKQGQGQGLEVKQVEPGRASISVFTPSIINIPPHNNVEVADLSTPQSLRGEQEDEGEVTAATNILLCETTSPILRVCYLTSTFFTLKHLSSFNLTRFLHLFIPFPLT